MKKSKYTSKYWICDECAAKHKLIPPKGNVTCIKGKCGYCMSRKETRLTPLLDFDDPTNNRRAVWD